MNRVLWISHIVEGSLLRPNTRYIQRVLLTDMRRDGTTDYQIWSQSEVREIGPGFGELLTELTVRTLGFLKRSDEAVRFMSDEAHKNYKDSV